MHKTLIAIATVGMLSSGCGRTCTLMYVPSGVDIEIDEPLDDGHWVATLSEGTEVWACAFDVPIQEDSVVDCDPSLGLSYAEDGTLLLSLWDHAPPSLDVEITHEDTVMHQSTVTPTYVESEPNGKGCGVNRQADVTLGW